MSKLFLTSSRIEDIIKILPQVDNIKMAFIPTAADLDEDKWYIESDMNKLKELRISFKIVDIKGKNLQKFEEEFNDINTVYIAGGNTFYLLKKSQESSFDTFIQNFIKNDILYAGGSAGAVIAGPDISPIAQVDEPEKVPNLQSTIGFSLTDFIILPHYDNPKYTDIYKEIQIKFTKQ